jgi:hypothetical protein
VGTKELQNLDLEDTAWIDTINQQERRIAAKQYGTAYNIYRYT